METRIGQDAHRLVKLGHQGLNIGVMHMGCRTVPGTDQASLIQDKTQLPPNNPAMIALAFLADLPDAGRTLDADGVAAFHHYPCRARQTGVDHSAYG